METSVPKLPTNPRDKANIFSILFFCWTLPLFKKGFRKVLDIEDIFQPIKVDKSKTLGDRLERTWDEQQKDVNKRPSLLRAIASTFWREYLLLGFLCLINDVLIRIIQPQLLRHFLLYFKKDSDVTHSEAMMYATGMVTLNAFGALAINQLFITGYHNGMKVRVAVCSLIYRKALKLSHAALEDTAPGKMVNLLSNDVSRFDTMSMFLNSMWTAPLLVIVIGYMLWVEVRWAGMLGMLIVFIVVPIQSFTGKLSSKYRIQTALRTDERVRFMDEIISGIQVIKMYAWEKPFTRLIALARRLELKVVRKNSYVRALYMTFALFTTRMALFCTMLAIWLLYGREDITAAKTFVVSSYFNVISQTMSQMFVRGIAEIAEGLVAFHRLQNFLENDEKIEQICSNGNSLNENGNQTSIANLSAFNNDAVSIINVTARWIPPPPGFDDEIYDINEFKSQLLPNWDVIPTLKDVTLNIPNGKLIGIVGPIGSGKSSLLQALLRELPVEKGSIKLNGSISYACQEPWVFAGSVRQNILFGEEFNRSRYDAVVKACALEKDFEQFEYEDRTLVGEKGASLSGGQKARINLARAVYRRSDIYLLDDPLSAVDAHVGLHLFNQCIGPKGLLAQQKTTRILITHQIHFLKSADWIVVMRNGKIEAQGQPQDLATAEFNFNAFCDVETPAKVEENENMRRRKISRISMRSGSISSLHSDYEGLRRESEFDPGLIESLQYYEESHEQRIKGSLLKKYFKSGGHCIELFLICLFFILAQLTASGADFWVAFWTSQEERRTLGVDSYETPAAANDTQTGVNKILKLFKFVSEFQARLLPTETCVIVYSVLIGGIFFSAIIRSISFYNVCITASQKLHDNMFNGIITATMRFFNINPSGRILNRFAKDLGVIDELLPRVMLDAIQTNLNMIGAILLTAMVNPIFLVPISCIAIIFMIARNIYLRTSKNLKRLEGISRSPVFTHLSVSLDGLSTIRAFGAQEILKEEFDTQQDTHTACWYMFIATSSAFGFSLDILCFIFVLIVTFSFLLLDSDISGDRVGLAITQSMTMTGLLQWGIRHSVEVTNQMMSVERVLEYSDLETEIQPKKPVEVSRSWPNEGRIEFVNVQLKYIYEGEPVLRGISFIIKQREKIGIVGRTGAGKSSLIGALFRMAYIKGAIIIDNVDTSTIELQTLRSRIAIIPQDPVLFSGSLRINLDPFEEYPDDEIWSALEEVELKHIASGIHGLQLPVLAHGSNFSVGQRQLLCLARAILRKNRILVLDEATANVDPQTDLLIQRTIRSKFADCTVLTIAHRLHTIIDSDRVLVMDFGRALEFDTPHNLLTQNTGIFKEMVHTLGSSEVERFCHTAQNKHDAQQFIANK